MVGRVEFVRNPLFRGKIEKGSIDGMFEYLRNWEEAIAKKGYLVDKRRKASDKGAKLSHDVERSNQNEILSK